MGMAPSEPCIYDKLSESIDILRQSGYRYGMSEREIEKFIKQVLETNEPRREPPQFPVLRATVKFVVAVGFLLVAVLAFAYPHSTPQLDLELTGAHNWSSPLSHVRLLSLPIARKYNLEGCPMVMRSAWGLPCVLSPAEFHEWWSVMVGGCGLAPVNCSGCAAVTAVLEVSDMHGVLRGPQPVLFKGGAELTLTYEHLEQLFSKHREAMGVWVAEKGNKMVTAQNFPPETANFTVFWKGDARRQEEVLWSLFPGMDRYPLVDSEEMSLKQCRITHSPESQSQAQRMHRWLVVTQGLPLLRVMPVRRCQRLCSSFSVWLGPGDIGEHGTLLFQLSVAPACAPGKSTLTLGSGRWICSQAGGRTLFVMALPSDGQPDAHCIPSC
nr:PREDICTED: bombesin receptor-activated protein C6orf89 homolog isoform X1 [Lepisosteus oculatus]